MSKKDYDKCPICGGTNIVWNKDINNPFIRCQDCGYYLRKGTDKPNSINIPDKDNDSIVYKNKDNIVASNCDDCEKNEVCKYKEYYEKVVKDVNNKFGGIDYVDIYVNCKYYSKHSNTKWRGGFNSGFNKPLDDLPDYNYCTENDGKSGCPRCGSKETVLFPYWSVIPMAKCAKCGFEYQIPSNTYAGGITNETTCQTSLTEKTNTTGDPLTYSKGC